MTSITIHGGDAFPASAGKSIHAVNTPGQRSGAGLQGVLAYMRDDARRVAGAGQDHSGIEPAPETAPQDGAAHREHDDAVTRAQHHFVKERHMNHWKEELDLVEAAALRIEELELKAKRDFDGVNALAQARGEPKQALNTPEFDKWMAARKDSDAAWGRWYEVMGAKPNED